ncbi:hypothetical protein ACEPPN_012328 [Leptodophora sp. 'Broadleaf-Isolate-01']
MSSRWVELLPGYDDEPVHIRLFHHPLSSLPECEALSYEWGSPKRDHEVFCEGKVLKVTSNLLAALKRLRPSGQPVQKPRLLWIDALCINQEDIDERSEQVKLMTEIYRNVGRTLVWIGYAPPQHAQEAIDLIPQLATIIESLSFPLWTGPDRDSLPESLEIRPGYTLRQLASDPVFQSLLDILARNYFRRFWTVQEISLSFVEKTVVHCGKYAVSWTKFWGVAQLLRRSDVFESILHSEHKQLLDGVAYQGDLQEDVQQGTVSFVLCAATTYSRLCSEQHGRIFGMLGMVQSAIRTQLQHLDYSTPIGKVFQGATESMIRELDSLVYLCHHTVMIDSLRHPGVASWTLWSENDPLKDLRNISRSLTYESYIERAHPTFADAVLEAFGFVFDVVVHSSDNLSSENLESQVLGIYHELTRDSVTRENRDSVVEVLLRTATLTSDVRPLPNIIDPRNFATWIAELRLQRLGLSKPVLANNSKHGFMAGETLYRRTLPSLAVSRP